MSQLAGTVSCTVRYMVLTLITGLCLGWGTCLLIANRLRHIAWNYCPETPALIQSGCVYRAEDKQQRYVGFVLYSYKAETQTYYGTCARSFATPRAALYFVEECSARTLVARYKSETPERSILLVQLDDTDIVAQLGGRKAEA
jgi:hypothetical protein